MANRDIQILMLFVFTPLIMIIFMAMISACSPSAIRISEEVIEEVVKEEILENNK
jgi:hypothetical protein